MVKVAHADTIENNIWLIKSRSAENIEMVT